MKFDTIDYLQHGNQRQKKAHRVLTDNKIFERLSSYTPLLTGTIPINIDIETSDLDIICYYENKTNFIQILNEQFSHHDNFYLNEKTVRDRETVVATFDLEQFQFEIFGQTRPTREQEAYKHMIIEYEILNRYGEAFRKEIISLKNKGLKTEHAFAQLLGLTGDPYEQLLNFKLPE